jgi:Flp pilus assembly pilin Flp
MLTGRDHDVTLQMDGSSRAKEDLTCDEDPRSIKGVFAFRHIARRVVAILDDTSGATSVEYALMVAAIAGVIVVVVYALGVKANNLYNKASW